MRNPPYIYFDGTNLINSLFSAFIVPYECMKARDLFKDFENKVRKYDLDEPYNDCVKIILKLESNNKFEYKNSCKRNIAKFKEFIRHIRNTLCHAGNNDCVEFMPDNKPKI